MDIRLYHLHPMTRTGAGSVDMEIAGKVMVVDDDRDVLKTMTYALELEGYARYGRARTPRRP